MTYRKEMKYRRGPRLDKLREDHPYFIDEILTLGQEHEVTRLALTTAYAKWLGVKNWSSHDVRNLYLGLIKEYCGVEILDKKLRGVGLRQKDA